MAIRSAGAVWHNPRVYLTAPRAGFYRHTVQQTRLSVLLGVAILAAVCSVATAAPSMLLVENARMPLPPSGTDRGAVYLTLRNRGADPAVIVGVECALADSAMVHESTVVQGMARMRPIERLTLAAGQSLVLAPEGLHIMLVGLKGELHVGQDVPLVLLLADGHKVDAVVRVRPTGSQ
jgi:copper(I)-binding protein